MEVSFNDGWRVRPWASIAALGGGRPQAVSVTLPHDTVLTRTPRPMPNRSMRTFRGGRIRVLKDDRRACRVA
jgi:hypothetical protein